MACRYVLARLEQDGLIKKGDRLWQLGFGGVHGCAVA